MMRRCGSFQAAPSLRPFWRRLGQYRLARWRCRARRPKFSAPQVAWLGQFGLTKSRWLLGLRRGRFCRWRFSKNLRLRQWQFARLGRFQRARARLFPKSLSGCLHADAPAWRFGCIWLRQRRRCLAARLYRGTRGQFRLRRLPRLAAFGLARLPAAHCPMESSPQSPH